MDLENLLKTINKIVPDNRELESTYDMASFDFQREILIADIVANVKELQGLETIKSELGERDAVFKATEDNG